jgi:hypothetical protein
VLPADVGIAMHAYSGTPFADSSAETDDPTGRRVQLHADPGRVRRGAMGPRTGFNWMDFEVTNSDPLTGILTGITDAYSLGGTVRRRPRIAVPLPYLVLFSATARRVPSRPSPRLSTAAANSREASTASTSDPCSTSRSATGSPPSSVAGLRSAILTATSHTRKRPPHPARPLDPRRQRVLGRMAVGRLCARSTHVSSGSKPRNLRCGVPGTEDYTIEAAAKKATADLSSSYFFSAGLNFRF